MNIKAYYWMKDPKSQSLWKEIQFNSCIVIAKIIISFKIWLLIVKMIKYNCK